MIGPFKAQQQHNGFMSRKKKRGGGKLLISFILTIKFRDNDAFCQMFQR